MSKKALTKLGHLTDEELVKLIQQNQDYLGEVYKRCKAYCIQFMRQISSNKMSDYDLGDIYQDAILILYEKIIGGNFILTASLQTYLNSVCRYQLLNKNKIEIKSIANEIDIDDEHFKFNLSITETLEPIADEKESQFIALEKALEVMKEAGGKCYDLLIQFWYHKKSMNVLASEFDYSNDKTAKKQKSKCQEKLRILAFNEMKNN